MGGAGGHMWHPFDCPDVNSGQDLINFFRKSIEWAKTNKPALKIDGVNLSFRVRENPGMPTGYEFVVDRGSMKDLDVQGVTADNADQRFLSKDPAKPHGMVNATGILLPIFNDALPDILEELQQLGMLEDFGPYSKYFNTEFVLKQINVKEYAFDFIAIHSVNDFVQKGPKSRMGVETDYDQAILDRLKDKVKPHALKKEFRVYTSITTDTVRDVALEKALNENFTIVYSSQMRDPEEPGELGIGEGSTKSIKAWLADVSENPLKKPILISDAMIQKYPKMNKKQLAMAKNIYIEVLKGTAVNEIVDSPEFIEPVVDGVVIWHATRQLGNAVLDSLESEEFGAAKDQEGVVIKDRNICGGTRFKFTGDFIVGGLASDFQEQKFRQGRLLESFMVEAEPVMEQKQQVVVLIPGGFKPPTNGHYSMIKQYEKRSDVSKVIVVTGFKPRKEPGLTVTYQQSKAIFDIYGGFSDKVEFRDQGKWPTPMRTCYEFINDPNFISEFPGAMFALGASDKEGDKDRITAFYNHFQQKPAVTNAQVIDYAPAKAFEVDGEAASATRMRKAFVNGDWEAFKKLMPDDNQYDDVVQVLNKQTNGPDFDASSMIAEQEESEENFFSMNSLYSLVDEVILENDNSLKEEGFSFIINEQQAVNIEELIKNMAINLTQMTPDISEKSSEQKADFAAALINTIKSTIKSGIENLSADKEQQISLQKGKEEIEDELPVTEMSSMAGGNVQIAAGKTSNTRGKEHERLRGSIAGV